MQFVNQPWNFSKFQAYERYVEAMLMADEYYVDVAKMVISDDKKIQVRN